MGLLDKLSGLFGGGRQPGAAEGDPDGVHVYVQCEQCGAKVHLRLSKQYEIAPDYQKGGYVVHKTVVDTKCYKQIPAVFRFDDRYTMSSHEMPGAHLITREQYEAPEHK